MTTFTLNLDRLIQLRDVLLGLGNFSSLRFEDGTRSETVTTSFRDGYLRLSDLLRTGVYSPSTVVHITYSGGDDCSLVQRQLEGVQVDLVTATSRSEALSRTVKTLELQLRQAEDQIARLRSRPAVGGAGAAGDGELAILRETNHLLELELTSLRQSKFADGATVGTSIEFPQRSEFMKDLRALADQLGSACELEEPVDLFIKLKQRYTGKDAAIPYHNLIRLTHQAVVTELNRKYTNLAVAISTDPEYSQTEEVAASVRMLVEHKFNTAFRYEALSEIIYNFWLQSLVEDMAITEDEAAQLLARETKVATRWRVYIVSLFKVLIWPEIANTDLGVGLGGPVPMERGAYTLLEAAEAREVIPVTPILKWRTPAKLRLRSSDPFVPGVTSNNDRKGEDRIHPACVIAS